MITVNIVVLIVFVLLFIFIGMIIGYNLNSDKKEIEKLNITLTEETNRIQEVMSNLDEREEEISKKEQELKSDDSTKLQFTKDLLEFIDSLVDTELINSKRFELILDSVSNERKPKVDIDNSIKEISTNVFDAIKPQIYDSPYSILKQEYLMKYIQKRSFLACMAYIENNVSTKL